jgi:hypothetical protein
MILILGLQDLFEGGEGILDYGRQHSARVSQSRAESPGVACAGRPGRLADRAPLTLRRLAGRRLVRGRVPHVGAGFPVLAQRPLDLVGNLIGHAASAGLHQPALEIGDGVGGPGRLAGAAGLAIGTRLASCS